jgi:hypothetical protein
VVEGAKEIEIASEDERELKAKLIGADPKSDLAVLRIEGNTAGLKSLELADSARMRRERQTVCELDENRRDTAEIGAACGAARAARAAPQDKRLEHPACPANSAEFKLIGVLGDTRYAVISPRK